MVDRYVAMNMWIDRTLTVPSKIKNAVRTGLALAKQERVPLTLSHLNVAINAFEEFNVDFQGHGAVENINSYS
jgi:hypothetical protein